MCYLRFREKIRKKKIRILYALVFFLTFVCHFSLIKFEIISDNLCNGKYFQRELTFSLTLVTND